MPTEPTTHRDELRPFITARHAIRLGSGWSPVRASMIWPIAQVLEARGEFEAVLTAATAPAVAGTVFDLVDSGMIAPPRPRRRRERPVSSRAVFYQAAEA